MPSLYNKYRPKQFADVIDQDNVVTVLKNSVELDKISHAYLFCGPKGTGKTTLARILAKAVNCQAPKQGEPCNQCSKCRLVESSQNLDITEIDAASHTGVENIRELKENIHLAPSILKHKVYVIDEAHMLSKGAFNALLKSLEEPPSFVIFILATTEIHKVPPTIISRCQCFNFKRIQNSQVIGKLKKIARGEKVKITDSALAQIAAAAEGGMRDAESLLEQIINLEGKKVKSKDIQNLLGIPNQESSYLLLAAIANQNLKQGFEIITNLTYSGHDVGNYLKSLIEYARDVLVLKINPDHQKNLAEKMDNQSVASLTQLSQKLSVGFLGKIIAELIQAKNLQKDSPLPQIPLELALTKLINTSGKSGSAPAAAPLKTVQKFSNNLPKSLKSKKKSKIKAEPAKPASQKLASKPPFTIKQVYQIWPRLIKKIKAYNHSLWAILQNCQPVGIDEAGEVIIKTKYSFHKSRLEDTPNKKIIKKIADELLASNSSFCYLLESEIPKNLIKKNRTTTGRILKEFGGQIVE